MNKLLTNQLTNNQQTVQYKTVIGLEVHVELNTKTKMFCRCSADYFGKEPNSNTCPTCLGLPGALPMINQEAIDKCIQIGLALNCSINEKSYFERKNYFYPDLAKGFQTSQLVLPVAVGGYLDVENDNGEKRRIRINRAHQEEDTGKLTHQGGETLIDFNRSSVPLVEIVTEADFTESSQIRDYAKKLQQIFRAIGVSNADMERGDMRLEANVSVKSIGESEESENQNVIPTEMEGSLTSDSQLFTDSSTGARNDAYLDLEDLPPYRVELKNINSFRFMVAAVEYEIKRQIELYEAGRENELRQETRGWNEDKKETYLQRSKEDANDYRYFPEPDLPELRLEGGRVKGQGERMAELPMAKVGRYVRDLGVREVDARILAEDSALAAFFESAVEYGTSKGVDAKQVANYIINQKIDLVDSTPQQVVDDILAKKSSVISDEGELENIAQEVINENPGMVEQYKGGKESVIMALVGGVMRKTQGKADAVIVKVILEKLLN